MGALGKICEDKVRYEYEYKKEVSCTMSDWSDWGEWKTKREATNSNKKEETKTETTTKEVVETKEILEVFWSWLMENTKKNL